MTEPVDRNVRPNNFGLHRYQGQKEFRRLPKPSMEENRQNTSQ